MAGWTDAALGVSEETRAERERRRTYLDVLDHLPEHGVVDDRRADGSHLKIYKLPGFGSAGLE